MDWTVDRGLDHGPKYGLKYGPKICDLHVPPLWRGLTLETKPKLDPKNVRVLVFTRNTE